MVDVFGATSTTEDVLSGINLRGERIFVTGVSAGLGLRSSSAYQFHLERSQRARSLGVFCGYRSNCSCGRCLSKCQARLSDSSNLEAVLIDL